MVLNAGSANSLAFFVLSGGGFVLGIAPVEGVICALISDGPASLLVVRTVVFFFVILVDDTFVGIRGAPITGS